MGKDKTGSQVSQQDKPQGSSLGKKIFLNLVTLSGLVFVILFINATKNCDCLTSCLLKGVVVEHSQDDTKWAFIRIIAAHLALYVFLHTMAVMLVRIVGQKSSPSTREDPTVIKLLNRIIANTIEQSFIFLPLLAYFLFEGPAEKIEAKMIMNIGAWFLAGRWIFSVGYLFGTLIGVPQLRGLGFGLTIMPIIFILEHIFCKEACLSNLVLSLNL